MVSPDSLPIVVVTCRVLADVFARLLPAGMTSEVQLMDYGLHRVPAKLTFSVQQVLDGLPSPSLVVLGYGLCGNGLRGIRAGQHVLLIPRTDDCIAILLGSYKAYMRQFATAPGTYYLTRGWLESGSNPLQEYEEYAARYGPEEAMWLVDQQYQHYERLVLVAPNETEMAACRERAQEVARFCERWQMRYEEILGSDDYVCRLIEAARLLQANGVTASAKGSSMAEIGGDFLVIPPGAVVEPAMFMR